MQGEARAADDDLVVLPDLEDDAPETKLVVEPVEATVTPAKRRRRRWLGMWTLALATAGLLGAAPHGTSRRRGY